MTSPKVAISVRVDPPFRDLQGRFVKASDHLDKKMRTQLIDQGRRLYDLVVAESPEKTGEFKKGIRWRTIVDVGLIAIVVSLPDPLGRFLVGGTRAHPIVARNANVLRFYWAKGYRGAGIYYFKSVNHPGTKPNRITGRAYRRWLPGARAWLGRFSKDFVRDLGYG